MVEIRGFNFSRVWIATIKDRITVAITGANGVHRDIRLVQRLVELSRRRGTVLGPQLATGIEA
jgi:3-polyprenyl-4-hydroxybenzoate decarboxylase